MASFCKGVILTLIVSLQSFFMALKILFFFYCLCKFVKLDRDIVFLVVCKLRIYAYKCNFYHHLCGGCSIWLCFQMSIYLC